VVLAVLFSLAAAEVLDRFYYLHRDGVAFFGPMRPEIATDPQKGWKATPDFAMEQIFSDTSGNAYSLVFHQDGDGFREFQDLSKRPRILVIGDSHTQDWHASDGRTWYAEVGRRLRAQVFAYGVAGYGTLQELMVLETFLDRIDPDAIILQVSTNDVINNTLDLERQSFINNVLIRRPYYRLDGGVSYALPARDGVLGILDSICAWMGDIRLVRHLREAVIKAYVRLYSVQTVEFDIARDPSMPLYRDSLAITEALFARVKSEAGPRLSFAFVADDFAPVREDLEVLLRKVGFILISGIPEQLANARKNGWEVLADGVHWNEDGNKIAGETIARDLAAWFPPSPQSAGVVRTN